jgi:hypothetical protein
VRGFGIRPVRQHRLELPRAPRLPSPSRTAPQPLTQNKTQGLVSLYDPTPGKRDMGMPPSVAALKLPISLGGAMKKHPSHRRMERFSSQCCGKNTNLPSVCPQYDQALGGLATIAKYIFYIKHLIRFARRPAGQRTARSWHFMVPDGLRGANCSAISGIRPPPFGRSEGWDFRRIERRCCGDFHPTAAQLDTAASASISVVAGHELRRHRAQTRGIDST